ncbi:uncharacterized protein M421DRAFT_419876 [Didymella exigua CBS 183.55]|uniref:Malate dehydrogenase n=1 Tax=Didymella exigua CBS 183.55 TaxID=1150837 RepID=A0A6A5RLP6_9PLEO|nr:uncharacterized protein M421DRAFT_419876 [Didymella exigua CBS 183.55]KAF1929345.1 hypothetical protein M421DRAFT_419876 [Didymella exigua CBS 183.55]
MLYTSIFAACALPLAVAAPLCTRENNTTCGTALCNLSNVSQPTNALTPPSADLRLVLIAHGEGTQNYTCATPESAPSSIGAKAELYNASCEVANPTEAQNSIIRAQAIGNHFFADLTTPEFDIPRLGNTKSKKVEEVDAPNPSADIKWLRLQAQTDGSTSDVKFIYRLNTVGGHAPTNCEGRAEGEVVTVQYQAQYWMYA